ncbi:3-phosphoshikimate 1-carboxyvinyltransferase [Candidatus Methanocrinis natronophilus]|uniref:3-phosphoshikimate 1-carboxyvinyltransferase n=1 Tax=Candidatus Methanocrinis natronophilus TaxID=3033396 RepID=A0ABT5X4T4_9EURY|nr:3-phosphoshikimate 1-carboxyvinyltransferase [Candidatus Methanocrinis natronophilus]MDF0589705.1 3-phosphoshikimate 1-carboxyvinyltransferase [Candidatus Methanocrinis natronophilus]
MIASVERSQVSGEVAVPPSKSYTHRAITISALGPGGSVKRPLLSADTRATIAAAEALGAEIAIEGETLAVAGVGGRPKTPDNVIDVENSGTTLRIMAAVAALTDGAVLTGDASIRGRPNGPLLKSLNDLGGEAFSIKRNDCAPLVVRGKIRGGRTVLDGRVSSQFLSALLISCPLAEDEAEIVIDGELKSRPYAEITLEMLEEAGGKVETDFERFFIQGGQRYHLEEYTVPGDFSSASYLLAAAAVTGSRLMVRGLRPSRQGDSAIVSILRDMGAKISWDQEKGDLVIEGGDLEGVEVDASLTPDLVPTIAVLGSLARGKTVVKNAEHVRHKETDRLSAMAMELSKMGADIEERPDGLVIEGGRLEGAIVSGHHDHRIVMALTVAGLAAGDTRIDTAESVSVSYPSFFEDMARIGCLVEVGG